MHLVVERDLRRCRLLTVRWCTSRPSFVNIIIIVVIIIIIIIITPIIIIIIVNICNVHKSYSLRTVR